MGVHFYNIEIAVNNNIINLLISKATLDFVSKMTRSSN